MRQRGMKSKGFSWFWAIAAALLIVLFLRLFFIGNYIVDGPSMEPTLYSGDRLIVNKWCDHVTQLHHFDVIIFRKSKHEDYVKRVIGLPGDSIRYSNDHLFINGRMVSEPYLDAFKRQLLDGQLLTWDFTLKSLTGGSKVPAGKLWVMGDNRQQSFDSRRFFFVDEKAVIGKVELRYWPLNQFGRIGR